MRRIQAPGWERCAGPAERFDSSDVAVEAYVRLGEMMPCADGAGVVVLNSDGNRERQGLTAHLAFLFLILLVYWVEYPVGDRTIGPDAEFQCTLEDGRTQERATVLWVLLVGRRARWAREGRGGGTRGIHRGRGRRRRGGRGRRDGYRPLERTREKRRELGRIQDQRFGLVPVGSCGRYETAA